MISMGRRKVAAESGTGNYLLSLLPRLILLMTVTCARSVQVIVSQLDISSEMLHLQDGAVSFPCA